MKQVSFFALLLFSCLFLTNIYVHAQEHNETDVPPCVRFGGLNGNDQTNYLIAILSNAAFGNKTFNSEFIGLFAPDSPVLPWFDGTYRYRADGQKVNFTENGGNNNASAALLSHMVAFFGPALGCNATDFPIYNASFTLYDVHRNMNYGKLEYDFYVNQFVYSFEYLNATVNESRAFRDYLGEFSRCAPTYGQTCNDISCDPATYPLTAEECALLYPSEMSSSLCSKYAYVLSSQNVFPGGDSVQNEQALLMEIVTRAILGNESTTPPVPGILVDNSPLAAWFNGSIKYRPDAPDYYKNETLRDELIFHFVTYMGDLLTCAAPGWSTSPYNFLSGSQDMFEVHRNMGLTNVEMVYFLEQFQLALESISFTESDRDIVNTTTKIFYRYGAEIFGYRAQICGEASCDLAYPNDPSLYTVGNLSSTGTYEPTLPLCNRYLGNDTLTQIAKTTDLITMALRGGDGVTGIMSQTSEILSFFNGKVIYRPNGEPVDFTANNYGNDNYVSFVDHLATYFLRVLECDPEDALPAINNAQMFEIHRNMKISNLEFSYFITQIGDAAAKMGFDKEDVAYLQDSLNFFGFCAPTKYGGLGQICNANGTVKEPCPRSEDSFTDKQCADVYIGNSMCSRLTYLNQNYNAVQSEADFLFDVITLLFNGSRTFGIEGLLNKTAITLPYFDGTIKYRGNETVNYTDPRNYDATLAMMTKTYTHLGQLLGCNAPGYGIERYNFRTPRQDLYYVHSGMNINSAVFDYYNDQVKKVLLHFGATPADINALQSALSGYGKCGISDDGDDKVMLLEICSDESCPAAANADCSQYPGANPSSDGSDNKTKIIIIVVVVVGGLLLLGIAYYCYRKRRSPSTSFESTRLMAEDGDVDTYRSTH